MIEFSRFRLQGNLWLGNFVSDNSIISTLVKLRGNPRACVYTEPLWGIPYNLYAPYASLYMLALGVTDAQIGMLASIGLALQVVFAFLSGAITDKFGRKRTTLIADLTSWSIPMLILAGSQNLYFFLAAVIIGSLWRISSTSWSCMLVEDADQHQLVHIYTWIEIAGYSAAFFSPIAGLLIGKFSLVPTVRGLYIFAFFMMTIKFLVFNHFVTETHQGTIRKQETRHQTLISLLVGYLNVLLQVLRTPRTLLTVSIQLVMSIGMTIENTFWAILVTKKLHIPDANIAYFSFFRSIAMLVFYFMIMPRISSMRFKRPLMVGFLGLIASQTLLISMPEKNYGILLLAILIDAWSVASINPFLGSTITINVDPQERARIMAILSVLVITLTSPFGWIAGRLSEANRVLPFVLNIAIFAIGFLLVPLAAWAVKQAPGT
jgi:DHA1 family tetracycline resistance protein-like MFS transporter